MKYQEIYLKRVTVNEEDNETIVSIVSKAFLNEYKCSISPNMIGVIFMITHDTIMKELKEISKTHSAFSLNLCDRLKIGFDSGESVIDDEIEKAGNICINMTHCEFEKVAPSSELDDTAKESLVRWSSENMIDHRDLLNKIAIKVVEEAKKYYLCLVKEIVMPLYIKVYEAAVEYVLTARTEKDDFSFKIYLLDSFYIKAVEFEDGIKIVLTPSVASKQLLKDDVLAKERSDKMIEQLKTDKEE